MTWVHGTIWSRGWLSSSGCTARGRPTSGRSIPNSGAASAAPLTISAGAKSPPMASTAIRIRDRASDIEVPDALGVRLDELLARLDVRSHQLLERIVDRRRVFDRHL